MRGEEIVTEQTSGRGVCETRCFCKKSSPNASLRKVVLCLRGFRVEERLAMNKRMGRASFRKLLLVFFVAAHPLPAQEARKAIHIAVDLREAPKRIYHAKMEFPVAAGPNRAEPLQPAASRSSCCWKMKNTFAASASTTTAASAIRIWSVSRANRMFSAKSQKCGCRP